MKVLYKNKTIYNKENYSEFLGFHQEKYSVQYYLCTILLIIAVLYCVILQFQAQKYILSLCTLLILIIVMMWRFYKPIKTVQKEMKSKKITQEQEFIFKFYDKYFQVCSKRINNKIKYWNLRRAFETDEFFYLYIDKTHAFLISKQGFSIGTSEEFSKFIKRKTFLKFKKYR